jgi:hypothetical protein
LLEVERLRGLTEGINSIDVVQQRAHIRGRRNPRSSPKWVYPRMNLTNTMVAAWQQEPRR